MELEHKWNDSVHRFKVTKKDFFTKDFPYYGMEKMIRMVGPGSLSYLRTWEVEDDEYKETYKCVRCPLCEEVIKVKRESQEFVGKRQHTAEYSI